jgi:hypothetical protein
MDNKSSRVLQQENRCQNAENLKGKETKKTRVKTSQKLKDGEKDKNGSGGWMGLVCGGLGPLSS